MAGRNELPLFSSMMDLEAHLDALMAQVRFSVTPISRRQLLGKFWKIEKPLLEIVSGFFRVNWVECKLDAPWQTLTWRQPRLVAPHGDVGQVLDPDGNFAMQIMVEPCTATQGHRGGPLTFGPSFQSSAEKMRRQKAAGGALFPFSDVFALREGDPADDPRLLAWGHVNGVGGRIQTTTSIEVAVLPLDEIIAEVNRNGADKALPFVRVTPRVRRDIERQALCNEHAHTAMGRALRSRRFCELWLSSFQGDELNLHEPAARRNMLTGDGMALRLPGLMSP